MKVKSFAMLLPCGIDVFSGVEFVCCPMTKKGAWNFYTNILDFPFVVVDNRQMGDNKYLSRQTGLRQM